ncbi:macro domain-containing protein [Mycobacteroides abscessus]|uniref:macro domain-containing protein n=2 Tax=Mycobacteroides abscessus TaxID=36809 RepID=UPI0005E709C7|nr:macro domain-containing protein [Mycobacteroides abscessus]MBN7381207.1 macro domain-containing protein [Mycobacteroides abscessus subsp. massiliense]CPZ33568.1 appr-1-p processing domain-containing protein [Mycobacteroides abscessus]CPZ57670.1 appr-1-p processing domain-containing protein [Mycobacteroides abscessus]SHO94610.1 appr-1-p processing domain-containing protein [Mycobacteroides abscessus subsp. abscessus]SHR28746.1 appr-1-p processing domain-containing protein [Mycobacteroides ab
MHTGCVLKITAVCGDITQQEVDAVVNPANTGMRGGGGADGAIHRAGGPAILRDCIERFPNGLPTGDAGWTTAGDLPAQWVIHTVGPNYNAGQRDRSLLESCYRRAMEVADELGARVVASPLISTGAFGWPRKDAIAAAIESIASANSRVEEVRLVAFDSEMHEQVSAELASSTPIRILQGVRVLHQRGYHRLRILPGVSPSGMYWRVAITLSDNLIDDAAYPDVTDWDIALRYSTGGLTVFAGGEVTVTTTPERVADLILSALPEVTPTHDDPAYMAWFAELLRVVERTKALPVAYADYFDAGEGWEVGWGSGVKHPRPPRPPAFAQKGSSSMPSTLDTGDTLIVLDRLGTVLQWATGLSPKASAVEGTFAPRGDTLSPGVTIKFAAKDVRGADRAALFADGQFVHLGVWPAELQPQYTYLYSDRGRVDALLELDAHAGFTVEPNFQLAHRFAQPLQRWIPTRLLSAEEYLGQWIDDFQSGRAGGRTRDEIADPDFFGWLVERRYARAAEQESLHHWLDGKKAGIQIHIRPGVQIRRTWSYAEAFAVDNQHEFAAQVRKAADQVLIALGQTNPSSAR